MKCDRLLKEALDGIEFRYKLNDTLDNLAAKNPNQKFSANQLEGYLVKQGVSPKEIKASGIFEKEPNGNVLTIKEWAENNPKEQMLERALAEDNEYNDVTLFGEGFNNSTYKENFFFNKRT